MKLNKMILPVIMIVIVFAFAGCGTGNTVEEDMAMDLGGDITDLSGDETNAKLEWHAKMPDSIPEFTEGTIVQSSFQAGAFGTQSKVTMGYESVSEDSYNAYVEQIGNSSFTQASSTESGGISSVIYADGENTLSLQFAAKSGQLIISYSGN